MKNLFSGYLARDYFIQSCRRPLRDCWIGCYAYSLQPIGQMQRSNIVTRFRKSFCTIVPCYGVPCLKRIDPYLRIKKEAAMP